MARLTSHPAAGPKPWRLTRAEYHRLGESGFFRGRRVQLIAGEVVVMSPMGYEHRVGILRATDCVRAAFGAGVQFCVRLPLRLWAHEPEPDVSVVAGAPEDYGDRPSTALLIIEVADSTLSYDLTVKAELYAEAGLQDYWEVDLAARQLHVLCDPRPVAAGGHTYFRVTVLSAGGSVAPRAAPRSPVRVANLLP